MTSIADREEISDASNLGLGLDSFHAFTKQTALDPLELLDPSKIFLVQLADFMWTEIRSVEERITTARHFRVFPGEGVHSALLAELVLRLDRMGYRGDFSFEVFNDDDQQIPLPTVAARARLGALAERRRAAALGAVAGHDAAARGRAGDARLTWPRRLELRRRWPTPRGRHAPGAAAH